MKYLFFVLVLLLTQFSTLNAQDQWVLAKDKDEVQIFTRKLDHRRVKEFKAVTYTSKSVDELEAIIKDVELYPDWVYSVTHGELLETNGESRILYYIFGVPWPVSDRDMVIESFKTTDDDGNLKFDLNLVKDLKPEVSGYVRMKEVFGSWTFIPKLDKTKIIYQFYGDPSGSLPAWLINMFIVDGPHETLVNLRNK